MTPHTESRTDRFLAFRERHAGTIQDVCSGLVILAVILIGDAYFNGFFGG